MLSCKVSKTSIFEVVVSVCEGYKPNVPLRVSHTGKNKTKTLVIKNMRFQTF